MLINYVEVIQNCNLGWYVIDYFAVTQSVTAYRNEIALHVNIATFL